MIGQVTFQKGLPNHKQVLGEENVNTILGKGKLFILKRENNVPQYARRQWIELIVQIEGEGFEYPNYIWMSTKAEDIEKDKLIIKQVASSIFNMGN